MSKKIDDVLTEEAAAAENYDMGDTLPEGVAVTRPNLGRPIVVSVRLSADEHARLQWAAEKPNLPFRLGSRRSQREEDPQLVDTHPRHGENPWPHVGNSRGRTRGTSVTVYEESLMAAVSRRSRYWTFQVPPVAGSSPQRSSVDPASNAPAGTARSGRPPLKLSKHRSPVPRTAGGGRAVVWGVIMRTVSFGGRRRTSLRAFALPR
jgi:hypothetical protein